MGQKQENVAGNLGKNDGPKGLLIDKGGRVGFQVDSGG